MSRRLKQDVYLWMKAWGVDDIGPYTPETKKTPYLEELEIQLIELAGELYPHLLNSDGHPYELEKYDSFRGWIDQYDIAEFE